MTTSRELQLAEAELWQFLNGYGREPAKVCFWGLGFGCADTRVAEHCAELYRRGLAQRLLFSGGFGRITRAIFNNTEAETFAQRAIALGVPSEHILREPRASNTAENVRFSFALLEKQKKVQQQTELQQQASATGAPMVVACRNIYRPRVAATLRRWQPQQPFYLASPDLTYTEFAISPKQQDPKQQNPEQENPTQENQARHALVGEIDRLLQYPKRGWLAPVDIPVAVLQAYQTLEAAGYTANRCPPQPHNPIE